MNRLVLSMVLIVCVAGGAAAQQPIGKIAFPFDRGQVNVNSFEFALMAGREIGLTLARRVDQGDTGLFSFSLATKSMVDFIDLTPEFGPDPGGEKLLNIVIRGARTRGFATVFGMTSDLRHIALGISVNAEGKLTKLWRTDLGPRPPVLTRSAALFSSDDELLLLAHQSGGPPPGQLPGDETPGQRLTVIRTSDGRIVQSVPLTISLRGSLGLFSHANSDRFIALSGASAFVFELVEGRLELRFTVDPGPELSDIDPVDLSEDGRFLFGYVGWFLLPEFRNVFVVYDLEKRTISEASFPDRLLGISSAVYLPAPSLLFYLKFVRLKENKRGIVIIEVGRFFDASVISHDGSGSLAVSSRVELPRSSEGGRNLVREFNNPVATASGAMVFLTTFNGRLFIIDTLSGEVIRDVRIDPSRTGAAVLVEERGLLIVENFTNELLLFEVTTRPKVTAVSFKKRKMIVKGENLLAGARVLIDGEERGIVTTEKGGVRLSVDIGKDAFEPGSAHAIVVVNRDGIESAPFVARR